MMPTSRQKPENEAIEVAREARGPRDHVNSHIHVLLLSSAISLIVSLTLPSWFPVLGPVVRKQVKLTRG